MLPQLHFNLPPAKAGLGRLSNAFHVCVCVCACMCAFVTFLNQALYLIHL